jgi:hypothetical protein
LLLLTEPGAHAVTPEPQPKIAVDSAMRVAEWERIAPPDVRQRILASSLGVEKVDHLGPRIGYLDLSGFPPPFLVAPK